MDRQLLEREAERVAQDTIRQFGFTAPPVDPFAIAKKAGLDLRENPSTEPGFFGALVKSGEEFAIIYPSHVRNDGFVRFTVAHELGHYFLPGHPEHFFAGGNTTHLEGPPHSSSDPCEIQADAFAAALLMPASFFRASARKAGRGLEAVEVLAREFNTSLTATAIRYSRFADHPVAIISSYAGTVEFCFVSESLRTAPGFFPIRKGTAIPKGTLTAAVSKDNRLVDGCERRNDTIALQDWFDCRRDAELVEDVVGLGRYGRTLTVLHVDADLEDEADEDDEPDEPKWR